MHARELASGGKEMIGKMCVSVCEFVVGGGHQQGRRGAGSGAGKEGMCNRTE